jgi:hypothetical protein
MVVIYPLAVTVDAGGTSGFTVIDGAGRTVSNGTSKNDNFTSAPLYHTSPGRANDIDPIRYPYPTGERTVS